MEKSLLSQWENKYRSALPKIVCTISLSTSRRHTGHRFTLHTLSGQKWDLPPPLCGLNNEMLKLAHNRSPLGVCSHSCISAPSRNTAQVTAKDLCSQDKDAENVIAERAGINKQAHRPWQKPVSGGGLTEHSARLLGASASSADDSGRLNPLCVNVRS